MNRTNNFPKLKGLFKNLPQDTLSKDYSKSRYPMLPMHPKLGPEIAQQQLPSEGKNLQSLVNETHPLSTKQQRFLALRRKMGGG